MDKIFLTVLYNSMLAVPLVASVLLFRALTRRLPKLYIHILWILVLAELVVPPLAVSPVGMKAGWGVGPDEVRTGAAANPGVLFFQNILQIPGNGTDGMDLGEEGVGTGEGTGGGTSAGTGAGGQSSLQESGGSAPGSQQTVIWEAVRGWLKWVWVAGICVVSAVYLIEFLRLKSRTATAVRKGENIWETGKKEIPFVMPGFPCRIYLPTGLAEREERDILSHERMHIRYGDPWIKVFSCVVLSLHWFNPMVWAAVCFLGKDMEMLCDERVLKGKGLEEKKRYSETLLHFSVRRSGLSSALSFGESNTESRIKHILYSHKPKWIISLLLLAVTAVCAVVFLTTSARQNSGDSQPENTQAENGEGAEKGQGLEAGEGAEKGQGLEAGQGAENGQGLEAGEGAEPDLSKEGGKNPGERGAQDEGEDQRLKERDNWFNMASVGEVFAPDEDMLERIRNAQDYTSEDKWLTLPLGSEETDGTAAGQELYDAVNLVAQTDHFKLYGTELTQRMILELPEGSYISMEIPFTSNYLFQPRLQETDYDGDGENELSIVIHVLHGTGVSIHTLLMADREEGGFKVYQYLDDEYLEELSGHFSTLIKDGARLLVDGKEMGRADTGYSGSEDYQYYAGSQIAFDTVQDKIVLNALLEGMSADSVIGDFSMGHELEADVLYEGGGSFRLHNVRYRESVLEERVRTAAYYYFAGDGKGLNKFCAAGSDLEAAGGSVGYEPDVDVVSIFYPSEEVGRGELTAVAAVFPKGGDSYDYLNLEMVFETGSGGQGEWKIRAITLEK